MIDKKEKVTNKPEIIIAKELYLTKYFFKSKFLKYRSDIDTADREPIISNKHIHIFWLNPSFNKGNKFLKSKYLETKAKRIISPIRTKNTVITTSIIIELNLLFKTYPLAIKKNIKQYQVGVDKKKLVCIELHSTEADSIDDINNPIENISNRSFPIILEVEFLTIYIKSYVLVFSQICIKAKKYKNIKVEAKIETIQLSLPP
nr:hypothetical protein [uncultured Clostridium sp.]